MGFSIGSAVNTVANVSSRKTDGGKSFDSSLYEFLNAISNGGVQVKANFEVEFLQFAGFQFYCQSVTFPGLKSNNGELYYKGRSIQVPFNCEQQHEFQMTVLNDASGSVYANLRSLMAYDYEIGNRMLDNGYTVTVKARGDGNNYAGMNALLLGTRITDIGNLDYAQQDGSVQMFTVNGYANFTDLAPGAVKRSGGLLGKVDAVSNRVSQVLGR